MYNTIDNVCLERVKASMLECVFYKMLFLVVIFHFQLRGFFL